MSIQKSIVHGNDSSMIIKSIVHGIDIVIWIKFFLNYEYSKNIVHGINSAA